MNDSCIYVKNNFTAAFDPTNKWCIIFTENSTGKILNYVAIPPTSGDRLDIISFRKLIEGYNYDVKGIVIYVKNGNPFFPEQPNLKYKKARDVSFKDFPKNKLIPGKTIIYYFTWHEFFTFDSEDENFIKISNNRYPITINKKKHPGSIESLYVCETYYE